ncbi:MAG: 16S rRNA (adenine(1518)-N(6)/adenine(1519)-N(6))-dimethyltransferase RsmA [Holosporales bacterium]|jgi:16S rRNA (adenine1518-N6/adenine1519-N6)-dimethyltransferase|nr:16S rRNA (adenine(1518)-N(6)/adenine(1519)-N(6))-dimethyltransferase RsmA [Holosporales bacterium]
MIDDGDSITNLSIVQIIAKYGLLANRGRAKSLGQHFLCDPSLLKKIVAYALPIEDDTHIVEIGPGPCGLTREIVNACSDRCYITCIEKDESLKPIHDELLASSAARLRFIYADAMKVRLQDLEPKQPVTIIANLPYNVGTPLLIGWLKDIANIRKMILMFQKEVADRICATTGTKQYGRLSIISQLTCHAEKMFDISRTAFYPPPKVESTVVKMIPRDIAKFDLASLDVLTAHCFSNRRKTLRKILKEHYGVAVSEEILTSCGIDANARPENVAPRTFLELSKQLLAYSSTHILE